MKHFISLLILFFSIQLLAQKDTLKLGDRYWEDQLYISVTYNTLNKQPTGAGGTGFSYGFATGYVKDIPFNKKGSFSGGLGLGYNYDNFNHGLAYDGNGNFTISPSLTLNKFSLHNIEMPIQLRWRTSDALTYSFWRIYAGVKLSYNLSNSFRYIQNNTNFSFSNISNFNKLQTGLEISLGYSAFNFYMYYGLTPMYKNTSINGTTVNTRIAKFGLMIYLL